MGSLDWWDTESVRHVSGYLLRHGKSIADRYPGRLPEAVQILRRHGTSWAKECREATSPLEDGGKTLWRYRVVQVEAEIANKLSVPTAQPREQIGLL